jgi:hypothetical protein
MMREDLHLEREESLRGVDRPASAPATIQMKKPGWQISKQELFAQGVRYLSASSQDLHPAYGLTHASYARLIFEALAHEGDYFPELLRKAGQLQEIWTQKILAKIPLELLRDPKIAAELSSS